MKIVLNKCYGGYHLHLTADMKKETGITDPFDDTWETRTNEKLISYLESHPDYEDSRCARLEIVEIPDEITDYHILEYDGLETLIYVLNSKIHFI